MLDIDIVKQDIHNWIVNFLEVRNPNLGNRSPCPYARGARIKQNYDVRIGTELLDDLNQIAQQGLGKFEVIICAYPSNKYSADEFYELVQHANKNILVEKDILVLDDHPDHKEEVNSVCFNQGKYTLALVQCLSDLNEKARFVAKQGFYDEWPDEYLESLFTHREDPRS